MRELTKAKLTSNTLVVVFFSLLSRITGLIRDIITAHLFGANAVMDAFNIAFTIPNTLRRFVAEGALTAGFVSIYNETLKKNGLTKAHHFYQSVFGLLLIILTILVFVGILGAPRLVWIFAGGFFDDYDQMNLTILLTRYMFIYVFLVSLVALSIGVLNSHNCFAAASFSPVLLNLSMIFSAYLFKDYFLGKERIFALCIGVVIGGIFQLIVQIVVLHINNLLLIPLFNFNEASVRRLFTILLPSIFGIAVYQINLIILRQTVSYLPLGQITCYSTADRIIQLSLGIFIISMATVSLPIMTKQSHDFKKLIQTWYFSICLGNFIVIPSAAGLFLIGLPVVSVLFFHGEYGWVATQLTASTIAAFAPGLFAVAFSRTTIQVFYALQDMKTPVYVAAFVLLVNLFFALLLVKYQIIGLAISSSLSSFVQMIMLLYFLKRKVGNLGFGRLIRSVGFQILTIIPMCVISYFICTFGNWKTGEIILKISLLICAISASVFYYLLVNILLHSSEVLLFKSAISSFYKKLTVRGT